ncbi:MAG: hypothetical protein HXY24_17025 [Rubrivivax sp.]|nr:hypothetical protein [Rubrivivax sp.]
MKPTAVYTELFRRVRWLRAWALAAALLAAAVPAAQVGCLAVLVGNIESSDAVNAAWQRVSPRSTAVGCCVLSASLASPSASTPRATADDKQAAQPAVVARTPADTVLHAGESRPATTARASLVDYPSFLKHTRLRL